MKYQTEYVIGKKTPKEWAGVYGYKPDDSDQNRNLGVMYAVARITTASKSFSSEKFAKLILDELQQSYFIDLEVEGKLKRLEEACWKMKARMDLILSRESELAESGIDMEMAIAILIEEFMYVVTIGESYVIIERDGHIVNIAEALEDTNRSGFLRSGSLEIEETDKFLLATSHSFSNESDAAELLETLSISVFKGKEKEGVSLMLIADESLEWNTADKIIEAEVEAAADSENMHSEIEDLSAENINSNDDLEPMEATIDSANLIENEVEVSSNGESVSSYDVDEIEQDMAELEDEKISPRFSKYGDDQDSEELEMASDNIKDKAISASTGLLASGKSFLNKGKLTALDKYSSFKSKNSDREGSEDEEDDSEENSSPFGSIFHIFKNLILKIRNHFQNNQTTYAYYLKNFLGKFQLLFINIRKWFRRSIIGKPEDRRFLNNRELKRNRWLFVIFVVFISIFMYTQIRSLQSSAKERQRVEEAELQIEQFEAQYEQIVSAVTAAQFNTDGNKTEIVSEITQLESSVLNHKTTTGLFPERHNTIIVNLGLQEDKVLLKERVAETDILVDAAKSFQGVDLTDLEEVGDAIFITDAGQDAIYKVSKTGNGVLDIHISNVEKPQLIVANGLGELIVFDQNSQNSISKFDPNTIESLTRLPNTSIEAVGTPNEIAVFGGNNAVYEIRTNFQQIFKRDRVGSEYAGGGAVFETDNPPSWKIDAELSNAVDIEAPFEIYTLVEGLGLRRYLAGGQNQISFETFTNFTLEDFGNLENGNAFDITNFGGTSSAGILAIGVSGSDTEEGRIYIFDTFGDGKQFKFKKQLVSDPSSPLLKDIKEIQIDPVDNTLFVLDSNKVLRFDI